MLSINFELADLSEDAPVRVKEGRGWVNYELSRGLFVPEGVAALNSAVTQLIAGGQWFQLWRGDVVSLYSPEMKGLPHARVRRGPLANQATGPSHR